MKFLPLFVWFGAVALVPAQSTLNVFPVAPLSYHAWSGVSPTAQMFFDLAVNTKITLRGLSTPVLSPVGQVGAIEIWLTNPGTATYAGNELNGAVWSLAARGIIVGPGVAGGVSALTAPACVELLGGGGLVLNPGSYGVAIRYVGVNPMLVAVGSPQTFTNAELSVTGGAAQFLGFSSALQPPLAGFSGWSWRGSLNYQNGVVPHACSLAIEYGRGCYDVCGSFHQLFTPAPPLSAAAAASAAMSGRRLSLSLGPAGYTLNQSTTAFVPPTAAATGLAVGDNGEVMLPLPSPFPYPGGAATTLFVHGNGYVSVASNMMLPGGLNWVPQVAPFAAAPATAWWSWHDYNSAEPGSGPVVAELVGNRMMVTWNGVESYPALVANPSTWQFQFDLTTGQVDYVWQVIDPFGGSAFSGGDDHLVGFSPGGPSPQCTPVDITALAGLSLAAVEGFPLQLTALTQPILGTTLQLATTRATTTGIGVNFLSLVPAPGFDLAGIGAPGCPALLDLATGVGNLIGNTSGLSMTLNVPLPLNPAFVGWWLYTQSVWIDPAANPLGLLTSNGIELRLQ